MSIFSKVRETVVGMIVGARMGGTGLSNISDFIDDALEDQDRAKGGDKFKAVGPKLDSWNSLEAGALAELELALEDSSWRDLAAPLGMFQFTRTAITKMISLSRIMYLVNPLIHRAVTVQELYVWGSGCEIKATDPTVQEVLDDFHKDPKNQSVIGENWQEREREQRIDGNTFFVVFTNRLKGIARIRILSTEYVNSIIFNPEDSKEPWFYKRIVTLTGLDENGKPVSPAADGSSYVLMPDVHYNPIYKRTTYDGIPIKWDAPIMHVKTGGLSMFSFGIPEMFSAINWATAYKKMLENFATVVAAYARWSMKLTGAAGKKGVAAAKNKLGTQINGLTNLIDTNPPPNTGSIMPLSGNMDIQPIKTARATTGPDEARALRTMVSAGTDTPEHFFGDSDVGNLATSKTLDRPTELKMISRQTMWENVIQDLNRYIILISITSPYGKLRQAGWTYTSARDPFDNTLLINIIDPADRVRTTKVRFPPILQQDVGDRVSAVVKAITLGGSPAEGIIPDRGEAYEWIAESLGKENPEQLRASAYPKTVKQGFADPKVDQDIAMVKAEAASKTADAAQTKANQSPPKPTPASK